MTAHAPCGLVDSCPSLPSCEAMSFAGSPADGVDAHSGKEMESISLETSLEKANCGELMYSLCFPVLLAEV